MKKKEMIKQLVLEWVRNSVDQQQRTERFIGHDALESRIDRNWTKEGIESHYDRWNRGEENIETTIKELRR